MENKSLILNDNQTTWKQQSFFQKFLTTLTYIYFCRIPLFAGVFLILFPVASLNWGDFLPLKSLLGGGFDLDPIDVFWSMLVAFMISWTILINCRIVFLYSGLRCGLHNVAPVYKDLSWIHLSVIFLNIPLIVGILLQPNVYWQHYIAIIFAFIVSVFILFCLIWIRTLVNYPGSKLYTRFVPHARWIHSLFYWADKQHIALPCRFFMGRLLYKVPPFIGRGYIAYPDNEDTESNEKPIARLLPGHGLWIYLCIVMFIVYVWLGKIADGSAMSYLLMLVLVCCWLLFGLTFFLDRYRIPTSIVVIGYITIISHFSDMGYYYPAIPNLGKDNPTPAQVIAAADSKEVRPIIIVTASGGGIQSAAWVTKILTGLEALSQKDVDLQAAHRDFAKSIRMISAVSGGAVGSLYFVNAYDGQTGDFPSDPSKIKQIVNFAERSSLDELMHGLVYSELSRLFIPSPKMRFDGRGQSLEEAWAKGANLPKSLLDWQKDVLQGTRPAIIFNATTVDFGNPMLMGTTDTASEGLEHYNFDRYYPHKTLSPITAARLSATFPLITPPARIEKPYAPAIHLMDGSLWDNFGINTAISWVNEALSKLKQPRPILIIQLRASTLNVDSDIPTNSKTGIFYPILAPAFATGNMVFIGNHARNHTLLAFLEKIWNQPSANTNLVQTVKFTFSANNSISDPRDRQTRRIAAINVTPPLSWHLTQSQIEDIDSECARKIKNEGQWQVIKKFLLQPLEGK